MVWLEKKFSSPTYKFVSFFHSRAVVLFSELKQLVSEETQSEKARRIFKSFDPEGNGFISTVLLEDVLRSLDLVSEPE